MQFMKVQIFKNGICNAIFQIKDDLNRNVKAIQNDLKSLKCKFFWRILKFQFQYIKLINFSKKKQLKEKNFVSICYSGNRLESIITIPSKKEIEKTFKNVYIDGGF